MEVLEMTEPTIDEITAEALKLLPTSSLNYAQEETLLKATEHFLRNKGTPLPETFVRDVHDERARFEQLSIYSLVSKAYDSLVEEQGDDVEGLFSNRRVENIDWMGISNYEELLSADISLKIAQEFLNARRKPRNIRITPITHPDSKEYKTLVRQKSIPSTIKKNLDLLLEAPYQVKKVTVKEIPPCRTRVVGVLEYSSIEIRVEFGVREK